MSRKTYRTMIVWLILALIVLLFALAIKVNAQPIAPNDPLPDGQEIPDVDGLCWEVTWRSQDGTVQQLTYICQDAGQLWQQTAHWNGCAITIETRCKNQPELDPPPVGRRCEQTGSRTFNCGGDVQEVKWEKNVKKSCASYVPLTSADFYTPPPPDECYCSCEGYYADAYRNAIGGDPELSLPLPQLPLMGTAPDLQVYTGDTIFHVGRWSGGNWGEDECFINSELKVKAKNYPPTYIDCTSGICSYNCADMHFTQTATILRQFVYLRGCDGQILECRGEYNGFDPCDPTTHTCLDAPLPYEWNGEKDW